MVLRLVAGRREPEEEDAEAIVMASYSGIEPKPAIYPWIIEGVVTLT